MGDIVNVNTATTTQDNKRIFNHNCFSRVASRLFFRKLADNKSRFSNGLHELLSC